MTNHQQFLNIKSIGLGITNKCNLNCAHCYSRALPIQSLTLARVKKILSMFPNIKKINFGTGESILNPDLIPIMKFFKNKKVEMALTTNGTTIAELDNKYIRWFKDIDVSLDFPTEDLHDGWRAPGTFKKAMEGLEKCQQLGINTSIALCLTNANYKYLAQFRPLLDKFKISLRINLYKPTPHEKKDFSLNYFQFWEAMKTLSENFLLVSNSEPILSIVNPGKKENGSPCGEQSVRIHPDGTIIPCVFLGGMKIDIARLRMLKEKIPDFCQTCNYTKQCRGGCLSRRILKNRIDQPDEYCPFYRGFKKPKIKFQSAKKGLDFIHAGYLCTMIVS